MDNHFCNIHNIKFERHEKPKDDGTLSVWYSHKNADGSYCNEAKVKTLTTPPQVQLTYNKTPDQQRAIVRQHSQAMALQLIGLLQIANPDLVIDLALVDFYTNYFVEDAGK